MDLSYWIPATIVLGLATFVLLFLFVKACDNV